MDRTRRRVRLAELRRRLETFDVLAPTAALRFLAGLLRCALLPPFGTVQRRYGVSNAAPGLTGVRRDGPDGRH